LGGHKKIVGIAFEFHSRGYGPDVNLPLRCRWLFSKGKVSKAKAISEKMAHRNGLELSENVWLDAKTSGGNLLVGLLAAQ